jgi:hypothetical protein
VEIHHRRHGKAFKKKHSIMFVSGDLKLFSMPKIIIIINKERRIDTLILKRSVMVVDRINVL